jgi:hypothetical protein
MQCWFLPVRLEHMQLDGLEAPCETRRIRQAQDAVLEPQPSNCLGRHGNCPGSSRT